MLVLEVEYLAGVAYAASAFDRAAPEWPPHPDRLFSALVCAWAERGEDPEECAVLEWLELLAPPEIAAPSAGQRDVVDVFVPPNDMEVPHGPLGKALPSGKTLTAQLAVLPDLRKNRQPRQFPATIPSAPIARFIWRDADLEPDQRGALRRLVRSVPYLGHSSSLVRLEVHESRTVEASHAPDPGGDLRLRCPYPGRLNELMHGYAESASRGRTFRPARAPAVAYREVGEPADEAAATVFGRNWIVLADEGGDVPALEAIAVVAQRLRAALMEHADEPVAEILSGHAADRSPSREPHLAIVPLADIGWRYSNGRLMGLGLVLPRRIEDQRDDPGRRAVIRAVVQLAKGPDGGSSELRLGRLGVWRLRREPQPEAASLQPWRYLKRARRWATVTPFVFDRFPKDKDGQDAAAIVVQACLNIGLPAPVDVELHKHATFPGAPSAKRHRGEPKNMGYTFPKDGKLGERPLRHLVLTFGERVRGPLILGAGRFQGLGLCLPLPEEPSR